MKKRSLTLADVAERAGVAPMTVSRAINSSGYVAEETRQRVMQAIAESHYRPNRIARSLRNQKTNVVGILLPDIGNPFSAELARVMEETLVPRGYSCFISTTQRSAERELAALGTFYDRRVDGMLVATRETRAGNEAMEAFAERGLPVVLVGRRFQGSRVDQVTANHFSGGFAATEHLLKLGHRRIAFIGGSLGNGAGLQRFQGYLGAMNEYGCKVPAEYMNANQEGNEAADSPAYSTQADGYHCLVRLMTLVKQPTAVFARNDYTAIGAICAAHDLGMRVPDDLAIVGFDNVALSAYTTPPLTTVEQEMTEQARQAAEFLLDRLDGTYSGERREVMLECELVVRGSTLLKGR